VLDFGGSKVTGLSVFCFCSGQVDLRSLGDFLRFSRFFLFLFFPYVGFRLQGKQTKFFVLYFYFPFVSLFFVFVFSLLLFYCHLILIDCSISD